MSSRTEAAPAPRQRSGMSLFERYLTLWVFLCIVLGVALGQLMPALFQTIGGLEVAQVNLPVGILIWVMIIPMLLKVDFGALGLVKQHWRGIGVSAYSVFSLGRRWRLSSGCSSRFWSCCS